MPISALLAKFGAVARPRR